MSSYRFYGGKLLTMQEPLEVTEGEVWTKDDRIVFAGSSESAKEKLKDEPVSFDREVDASGKLIMPGFKNAHTHSAMVFLRSMADDLPLDKWLNTQVFPREAKLDEEMIYHLTKVAILEYLTSGVTAAFEMYLTPGSIARSFEDMGMRCVQVGCVNNFSQSIELLDEMCEKLNVPGSLNAFWPGFHAEYTCSRELLEKVAALSKKNGLPVWCHNSETAFEVEECKKRHGMTPTALFETLGIYDNGGGGYHCVYLDDEDMEIFKKRDLTVVTNPASNAKLASGIAPLVRLKEAGINLAIGTDGPASNNCLDMFREMFLATALAKLRENDASACDAADVLRAATLGGAKAMGLKESDVIAPGKKADIIMLDLMQPNMQPENNIVKNIVYAGSKQNVCMTMINGVIKYMNGEFFVGEDVGDIYKRAAQITQSLR